MVVEWNVEFGYTWGRGKLEFGAVVASDCYLNHDGPAMS